MEREQSEGAGEELVAVREVGTRVEADLIEGLLRGEGIPCVVNPPPAHDGWWYGGLYGHDAITIRVRRSDLAHAQGVLAEGEQTEMPAGEGEFCPYCGEHLGDARERCPRCTRDISEWVALREEVAPARAEPAPAHMREHSTTWRFVVLLALAALTAMLLTPWGREVGAALLHRLAEWARQAPAGFGV